MSRTLITRATPLAGRLAWHGACLALVLVYENGFALGQGLNTLLGRPLAALVPFAAALGLAGLVLGLGWCRSETGRINWGLTLAGLLVAALALALPENQFPAKRIHVAQYLLLSLVVAGAYRSLPGRGPLLLTALVSALYGMHDEMIQGLDPLRRFGLMDLLVDALAGLAGALLVAGLRLFGPPAAAPTPAIGATPYRSPLAVALMILGVVLLLLPLPAYPDQPLPLWPLLPLLAGGVTWYLTPAPLPPDWRQAGAEAVVLALLLALYPALSWSLHLPFQ